MKVLFNGSPRDVASTKLGEIIKELGGPYKSGCIIAIISEKKGGELKNEFSLKTTKGEARIKIARDQETEAIALFHHFYPSFRNEQGRVGWVSKDVTAFGPFQTTLQLDTGEQRYKKWDVFFGFGGFDPSMTYLMVSNHEHEAAYGTAADAVIGKLTRGRSIIAELTDADSVEAVTPLVTAAERTGFVTTDLNTEILEGQEIVTYALVKLDSDAPMSSEHFLSLVRDEIFHVDDQTHTYVASEGLKGLSLPLEMIAYRSKYYLSVRNAGTEKGKIYGYRESRLPNPSHNVFGEVSQGGELIEYAATGDSIYTKTDPKWMMVVGKTQQEAEEFFEQEDIEQVREGNQSDTAVVVDQVPALTMEIMERGTVRTVGVEKEAVIEVNLFHQEAPKTLWYFKKVTGLINRPIGFLKVHFNMPGVLVLFEGNMVEAGTLVPENLPKGSVKKGLLGVTNMSRANRGMMGIRLTDSTEYGPTGETLDGANIALSLATLTPSTSSVLYRLKEGDCIYVKERK